MWVYLCVYANEDMIKTQGYRTNLLYLLPSAALVEGSLGCVKNLCLSDLRHK